MIRNTLRRLFFPDFYNNLYSLRFDGVLIRRVWCEDCAERMPELLLPTTKLVGFTSEECEQCQQTMPEPPETPTIL
jgi:hypothetical protein